MVLSSPGRILIKAGTLSMVSFDITGYLFWNIMAGGKKKRNMIINTRPLIFTFELPAVIKFGLHHKWVHQNLLKNQRCIILYKKKRSLLCLFLLTCLLFFPLFITSIVLHQRQFFLQIAFSCYCLVGTTRFDHPFETLRHWYNKPYVYMIPLQDNLHNAALIFKKIKKCLFFSL